MFAGVECIFDAVTGEEIGATTDSYAAHDKFHSFGHLLRQVVGATGAATQIRSTKRGMSGFMHPGTGQCVVLSGDYFERMNLASALYHRSGGSIDDKGVCDGKGLTDFEFKDTGIGTIATVWYRYSEKSSPTPSVFTRQHEHAIATYSPRALRFASTDDDARKASQTLAAAIKKKLVSAVARCTKKLTSLLRKEPRGGATLVRVLQDI